MNEILIDWEVFNQLKSMTGPSFLAELIDVFLNDSPELIDQMLSGLKTGNIEQVRRAAHSLKSNSASFGANRLAGVSRELEMIAKAGTVESAGPKLEELVAEYEKLVPQLVELKHAC